MTDADRIKKLKPTATAARSESLKDLSTLKCNMCGADVWSKNGCVGGYCVKKMVHFCVYCKKLVMQKQDRLQKEYVDNAIGVLACMGFCGRSTVAGMDLGTTYSPEKDQIDGNPQHNSKHN